MTSLGFENYAEALKIYLTKYREVIKSSQSPEIRQLTPLQTQSARGDNQNSNRPGSSGFGPSGAQQAGGASSSTIGATGGAPNAVPSSAYQAQPESSTNALIAAQLGENPEQDTNPFGVGNVYPPGNGHNGTSSNPY